MGSGIKTLERSFTGEREKEREKEKMLGEKKRGEGEREKRENLKSLFPFRLKYLLNIH